MTMMRSLSIESRDHLAAIADCEARRLAHTLSGYGVLTRWQLAELSGARTWQRGRFARALEVGIEEGMIRDLGCGFYAPRRPWPEKPSTRITQAPGPRGRRFRLSVRRVHPAS